LSAVTSLAEDWDMRVLDRYGGAGRSGMRRYKALSRDWRRRNLGRRTSLYFWTLFVIALVAVLELTPVRWRFGEGLFFGMLGMAYVMFPDAVMPDHIGRWQRGAWGEQKTAKALLPLRKQGWLIRHDLATRYGKGNRDHVAAGPAVYLLDTKLLKDEVWVDGAGLHVRRVDESRDEYVIHGLTERLTRAAKTLKRDLDAAVGFPVAVYPVVVIWGHFATGAEWDGQVAYVDGEQIAAWLAKRPVDLRDERKRQSVRDWLSALPKA
jgi:hypothetical protein